MHTLRPAAWIFAAASLALAASHGQDAPLRAAPQRPPTLVMPVPELKAQRIGRVDYVDLGEAAARLKMKLVEAGGNIVLLKDGDKPVAKFEDNSREADVLGCRVFLGDPVVLHSPNSRIGKIDFDRCIEPLLRPSLAGTPPRHPHIIAVDAGHGGIDFGKVNDRLGVNEKTFTLDTAKRLKSILESRGYSVVMTRTEDRKIELSERPAIAARAGADLFVSVHFNSVPAAASTVSGIEVFRFTPQYQVPVTRKQYMPMFDAALNPGNAHDTWNSIFALALQRSILAETHSADRGLRHDRLAVLRLAECPAALVEGGFLSNDTEAARIMTAAYRQQLAQAIADGIDAYARQVDALRAGAL